MQRYKVSGWEGGTAWVVRAWGRCSGDLTAELGSETILCSGEFERGARTPLHGRTGGGTDGATDFTRRGRTGSKDAVGNLKEGLGRHCMEGLEVGLGVRLIPLHKWSGVGLNFSEFLRDCKKMSGYFSDFKWQQSCAIEDCHLKSLRSNNLFFIDQCSWKGTNGLYQFNPPKYFSDFKWHLVNTI